MAADLGHFERMARIKVCADNLEVTRDNVLAYVYELMKDAALITHKDKHAKHALVREAMLWYADNRARDASVKEWLSDGADRLIEQVYVIGKDLLKNMAREAAGDLEDPQGCCMRLRRRGN